jgi:uncharacterized protein (DUF1499 family)
MNLSLKKRFTVAVMLSCMQLGCAGKPPATLGLNEGGLDACPDKPNCVLSMSANDDKHHIEPFSRPVDDRRAYELLRQVIAYQDRAAIVALTERYLRAEFKSRVFRFIDDVEFYFPPDAPVIHVRSASRIGYSDLGVNRKRIERIRLQYNEAVNRVMGGS